MKTYELVVPCHFGLEAVLKREIYDLGYEIGRVEDGRITFTGDEEAICRANIFLRTAERVLIQVGRFHAETFEELFQGIKALPWENYIPENGKFWVKKASSIKSKLFSPSDIQSIAKKAMVERLKQQYHKEWFPEDGAPYPVRIFLLKDEVMVTLDTSGDSLHKRGYRTLTSKAPLTETLAASLLMLTPWRPDRILVDPFCGSGTFPIEAAMIAANIAPGMNREFTAEQWTNIIDRKVWYECVKEAQDMVNDDITVDIQGYDIDGEIIRAARDNAKRAGVDHLIHFQQRPVSELKNPKKYGFVITNPPYGERISTNDLLGLYQMIGERLKHAFVGNEAWVLSYREECFDQIGLKASQKVPLFNGPLECEFRKYEIFDGKYKEFKSQEEGEEKKETEGEQAPRFRERKEFKPRREGEFKPRRDGESRPRREGEYKPRREGDEFKGDDRDRKPRGEFRGGRDSRGPREFRGNREPRIPKKEEE